MKTDTISHFLSDDGIRLTICDATSAAAEAQMLHALSEDRAAFLGTLFVGAALLATDFKNHEGISLKWETGSGLGTFHVDAYEGRYVRGFAEDAETGGAGHLFVTRYSLLRQPYTGAIDLGAADVSAGLADYLKHSEQIRAAVTIDWKETDGFCRRAAGFLAELLPQGDEAKFTRLFSDLSGYDMTTDGAAERLLVEGGFTQLAENPVSFRCTCGEERIRDALLLLPETEKEELIADGVVESTCRYCGKTYRIPTSFLRNR